MAVGPPRRPRPLLLCPLQQLRCLPRPLRRPPLPHPPGSHRRRQRGCAEEQREGIFFPGQHLRAHAYGCHAAGSLKFYIGLSSSTLALAVAAKQTRGGLICIRSDPAVLEDAKAQIEYFGLDHVVEFKLGDPCEVIRQYKNIDFSVIEHETEGSVRLFNAMDMNPSRSVVIVCHTFHGGVPYPRVAIKTQVRVGMKSKTLPLAGGMEVIKIGSGSSSNRRKRTFLVYET